MATATIPTPRSGLSFSDLYAREGLERLDRLFLDTLARDDAELRRQLLAARAGVDALTSLQESTLLLALAPHLESFLAWLFGIEQELEALRREHHARSPLYTV